MRETSLYPTKTSDLDLSQLNFVRLIIVLVIAFGYASTMPLGPEHPEIGRHLGYNPSWIGIQLLFFFSGVLALRSLRRHGSGFLYLRSRFLRNIPMLMVFTLVTVLLIYPFLGVPAESFGALVRKLGTYFFETVSCLNPGQPLPGLLDNARYMCLIQGAVWTFRWGVIAHISAAIGQKIGLFKHDRIVLTLAIISTGAYLIVAHMVTWGGREFPDFIFAGTHLAFPFLCGMAAYAYRHKLPNRFTTQIGLLAVLGGGAMLWYHGFQWSPAIEVLLTGFWAYAAWLALTVKTRFAEWTASLPDLTLCLYLVMWPTAQLILLAAPGLGPWGLITLGLPVALTLAYAANRWINQPIQRFINHGSFGKVLLKPSRL